MERLFSLVFASQFLLASQHGWLAPSLPVTFGLRFSLNCLIEYILVLQCPSDKARSVGPWWSSGKDCSPCSNQDWSAFLSCLLSLPLQLSRDGAGDQGVRGSSLIPPCPGTIVAIAMSCFTTGGSGKEQGANEPPPTGRVWERSKGDTTCPTTSQNPSLWHPSGLKKACTTGRTLSQNDRLKTTWKRIPSPSNPRPQPV